MPTEYIGSIPIPSQTPSGTFPLAIEYKAAQTLTPVVYVHRFGHGDTAAEQRFIDGAETRRWSIPFTRLSPARRATLQSFHESQGITPFTLNMTMPDGTTSALVVRFDGPLELTQIAAAAWSATLQVVEVPQTTPSYSISSTITRFPDSTTLAALLNSTQEIIPVLRINGDVYLSNRRMTLGGQLYQPRILERSDITQSIDGTADQFTVTLGNADRVFSLYSRATNLYGAQLQFSLYIVGTGVLLNLWSGEVNDFSGGASDKFTITAGDPLFDLRKNYPAITIDRTNPQFAVPDQPVTAHSGGKALSVTSLANDSAYGQPLQDVWVNDPQHPLPVNCTLISGRDESQYYAALGIVGRGPISEFYQNTDHPHTLDGQTWHGFGDSDQSKRMYGLRRAYGGTPYTGDEACANNAPDAGSNALALDENSKPLPTAPIDGVSFLQIRRTDPSGIQPALVSTHQMIAWISRGLGGWVWAASGTKSWQTGLVNPIWIAVNTHLRWVSAQKASAAPSDLSTNLQSSYWYHNATASQLEAYFDCAKAIADAAICDTSVTPIFTRTKQVFVPNISGPPDGYPLPNNWTTGSGTPTGSPVLGTVYINEATSPNEFWVYQGSGWVKTGNYTPATNGQTYTSGGGSYVTQDVSSEPQFTCQGIVGGADSGLRPLRDWLRDILGSCCGGFNFNFGKLRTFIRYNASVTDAFTIGNTIYGSYTEASRKPAFTRLENAFSDVDYAYSNNTMSYEDADVIAAIGRKVGKANTFGCTNKSQAARITTIRAREELGGFGMAALTAARVHQFQTTVLALSVEPGAVVSYTGPETGGATVKIRVTKWSLAKDYGLTVQGTTVTDSMYDLTAGPKPVDVPPSAIPERVGVMTAVRNVLPMSGQPFEYTETNDGAALVLSGRYCPPLPVANFPGVSIIVETPTGSGNYVPMGDRSYDGDPNATDSAVLGSWACRIPLASTGAIVALTTSASSSGDTLTFVSTTDTNGNQPKAGMLAVGAGVPAGATVVSKTGSTVKLSTAAPGVSSGTEITFKERWTIYLASRSTNGVASFDPNTTPNVIIAAVPLGASDTNVPAPQVTSFAINDGAGNSTPIYSRDAGGRLLYSIRCTFTLPEDTSNWAGVELTETIGGVEVSRGTYTTSPAYTVPLPVPSSANPGVSDKIKAYSLNRNGLWNKTSVPEATTTLSVSGLPASTSGWSVTTVTDKVGEHNTNAVSFAWYITNSTYTADPNTAYIRIEIQHWMDAEHTIPNGPKALYAGIVAPPTGAITSANAIVVGWWPFPVNDDPCTIILTPYTAENVYGTPVVLSADLTPPASQLSAPTGTISVTVEIEGTENQGGGVFSVNNSTGVLTRTGNSAHASGDHQNGVQSYQVSATQSWSADQFRLGVKMLASDWTDGWGSNIPINNSMWVLAAEGGPVVEAGTAQVQQGWNPLPGVQLWLRYELCPYEQNGTALQQTITNAQYVAKVNLPSGYGLATPTGAQDAVGRAFLLKEGETVVGLSPAPPVGTKNIGQTSFSIVVATHVPFDLSVDSAEIWWLHFTALPSGGGSYAVTGPPHNAGASVSDGDWGNPCSFAPPQYVTYALSGSISSSATTATIVNSTANAVRWFPSGSPFVSYFVQIGTGSNKEIVLVTAQSGVAGNWSLSIVRGCLGTTATSHSASDTVYPLYVFASDFYPLPSYAQYFVVDVRTIAGPKVADSYLGTLSSPLAVPAGAFDGSKIKPGTFDLTKIDFSKADPYLFAVLEGIFTIAPGSIDTSKISHIDAAKITNLIVTNEMVQNLAVGKLVGYGSAAFSGGVSFSVPDGNTFSVIEGGSIGGANTSYLELGIGAAVMAAYNGASLGSYLGVYRNIVNAKVYTSGVVTAGMVASASTTAFYGTAYNVQNPDAFRSAIGTVASSYVSDMRVDVDYCKAQIFSIGGDLNSLTLTVAFLSSHTHTVTIGGTTYTTSGPQ